MTTHYDVLRTVTDNTTGNVKKVTQEPYFWTAEIAYKNEEINTPQFWVIRSVNFKTKTILIEISLTHYELYFNH